MHIVKSEKPAGKTVLRITADIAELAPIKKHVLGHFTGSVKIPGFRTGKAPLPLIEKHVDQQAFADEFMTHAINELYRRALADQDINPLSQPEIKITKFVPYETLEFEAELESMGKIILPDYKSIRMAMPTISIDAAEIKNVLESLRKRAAGRKAVDRPAKDGDELVIDFEGKDEDGKPVAGADGKGYPLILGSDSFIPGFERNLLGAKAGDTKEFKLKFPLDYGVTALQGKNVSFKVTVVSVSELSLPKLDDSFAGQIGPFKSLAELKADIKKSLTAEKTQQARRHYENQLVASIAGQSKLDVPKKLVDEQILAMEEEEKRDLTYRGQTWQEHLKAEGITQQQHRDRNRTQAEERVKGGLVLSEIASKEKIEVSAQELDDQLRALKGQYKDPAMQAELDKPENQRDISNRLLTEKTVAKLVEYASK